METTRIKVKIGEHEFDAEGPVEAVQSQFEAFRALVSTAPRQNLQAVPEGNLQATEKNNTPDAFPHIPIEKILHIAGRIVSLTALPKSATDGGIADHAWTEGPARECFG